MKIGTDLYSARCYIVGSLNHALLSASEADQRVPRALAETILPMVQNQVSAQIKVRDFTAARLSIEPADAASWSDVRTQLISEAQATHRSELQLELAACKNETAVEATRNEFSRRERLIEHQIDSRVHNFSCTLDTSYNFLAR